MLANLMGKVIVPCFVISSLSVLPQKWSHGQSSACDIHWTAGAHHLYVSIPTQASSPTSRIEDDITWTPMLFTLVP